MSQSLKSGFLAAALTIGRERIFLLHLSLDRTSYPPASSSSNPPGGWNASTDTSGNRLSERRSSSTRHQASSQYSADYTTVTTLASGKRPHLGLPLSQVERHDAISCHATGKRSSCAGDDLIRIYVKFPLSGDRTYLRSPISSYEYDRCDD